MTSAGARRWAAGYDGRPPRPKAHRNTAEPGGGRVPSLAMPAEPTDRRAPAWRWYLAAALALLVLALLELSGVASPLGPS
jgi:hypothetical protein